MCDRRPTSRAARGTPTVAVFTPVVCGSCQLAMSSPLPGPKCPVRPEYIVDEPCHFKRIWTNGPTHCLGPLAVTHSPERSRRGPAVIHRILRTAAILLACAALGAAKPAPPQRIIAV